MGTWGPGVFENDAALDWLGLLDRLGFLAVATPMSAIGEYYTRNALIPAEDEQAFWASCAVIIHAAGGSVAELHPDQTALITREAERILKIPNLKRRIEFALERVANSRSELAALWEGTEEDAPFRTQRDSIREHIVEILMS
jgi:hypothetical protein